MDTIEYKRLKRLLQGFVVPVVLLVFCLIATIGVLIPAGQKTYTLFETRQVLQEQVQALRQKTIALQSLDEATLTTNLTEASSAVPSDKSIATLFSAIDGLTGTTGVSLNDITLTATGEIATDSAKKKETIEEKQIGANLVTFAVTIEGTFEQIRNFVHQTTNIRRLFRVRQFTVTFFQGDRATARVTLDAFYAPLPTKISAISETLPSFTQKEEDTLAKLTQLPLLSTLYVQQRPSGINQFKDDPFSR